MGKAEREKRRTQAYIIGNKTEEGRLKINEIECCRSVAGDDNINALLYASVAIIQGVLSKTNLNLDYNNIIKIIISVLLGVHGVLNMTRAIRLVSDAVKKYKKANKLEDEILSGGNIK